MGTHSYLPAWVTEGVFLSWIEELLREADYIIWLDMPMHLTLKHTLFRRLRNDFGEPPPTSLFKQFEFLVFIGRYYFSRKRPETRWYTANCLEVYKEKLTRCRNMQEIEASLKGIIERYQVDM